MKDEKAQEHMKNIQEQLQKAVDADCLLDYDCAMLDLLERLNQFVEYLESNRPFLKERHANENNSK